MRRTTPGSSASPMMSPSRCGSATTTPPASAARSAAAQPGAAWPSPSSSRSSRRYGPTSPRRRRWPRHRRRRNATSRASPSIWTQANCKTAAEKGSRNASAWIPRARSSIPSIGWCRAKAPMQSATGKTALLEPTATTSPPPRATTAPTPTRIGRAIRGARHRSGTMGSVAAGSNGAPTPIPFGITSARRLDAVRPAPASER